MTLTLQVAKLARLVRTANNSAGCVPDLSVTPWPVYAQMDARPAIIHPSVPQRHPASKASPPPKARDIQTSDTVKPDLVKFTM